MRLVDGASTSVRNNETVYFEKFPMVPPHAGGAIPILCGPPEPGTADTAVVTLSNDERRWKDACRCTI